MKQAFALFLDFTIIISIAFLTSFYREKSVFTKSQKNSMVKLGAVMDTVMQKKHPEKASLNRKKQSVAKFTGRIPLICSIILGSVDKADIRKIYLFGSYAHGKPKDSSDIDICVVIRDSADRPAVYLKIAMNLTDNSIVPCDLVVSRESDFYGSENPNGIEHTIIEEGKLLYAG